MMAERNRLGRLQMGEAGHDLVGVLLGLFDESGLVGCQHRINPVTGIAQPEPEIGRDLVIA